MCWNMLHNSEKLWCKVLQDKYLGDNSLVFAPTKANISYTWRSILKASTTLKDGFNRQLGAGNWSLWYDNWSGFGKLCSYVDFVNISDTHLRVKDLWNDGNWDFSSLYTMVPVEVQNTSSGYRWTTELEDDDTLVSRDWNMVWRLKVLEKVKLLCWSGFHEALPSNALRFQRNMTINPMCLRCNATVEDLMHVFRDCPHSSSLWMNSVVITLLFGGRNSATFDSSTLDLNVVARNVHQDFWEWCQLGNDDFTTRSHWCPPEAEHVKINVDGSCIKDLVLWVEEGLRLAWNLGCKQIILEYDCLEAIQIISEDIHIRLQQIGKVVYEVRSWLSRDWLAEINFVVHEANQVANFMSKLGSHSSEQLRTCDFAPLACHYYLAQDLFPVT
ncbi:hypothetical protein Lal_00033077 [Lupinus albus]|nr:hypothetical protein Lal_00033077 [Lupinus albus]